MIPPLHAPDKMGRAANKAALMVTGLDFKLLGAASPNLTREQRSENARKAFSQWEALRRSMEALEAVAPSAAAAGQADADSLREIAG